MNIPIKKLKNGFAMSVYGLGTWEFGGKKSHNPDNNDAADIQAIRDSLDAGVTRIDTAEIYADGYTEILVGKAIKPYDRSRIFLTSKVYGTHLRYDDVITSAKASLQRLQTDYLDLYLTHRPNPATIPYEETMRALETLVEEGLVKQIGVSNYNVKEMQEAQRVCKYKLVLNQVHYNLLYREAEQKGVLTYCQENDMFLEAFRPLQKGMLSKHNSLIDSLSNKYNKTPSQLALNWLLSQMNVITLSKTATMQHLTDNLGAIGWQMELEDIEILRSDFPNQQGTSDTVPLNDK